MATKFINNFLITHPNLLGANLKINKNLELLHSASTLGRGTVLEPLRGHNSTGIKNTNHHEMFGYEIADWTSDFPMTWAEITDLKAQELWAQSRALNRPVLLRWSGGIDSTLVLIALLKHARADDPRSTGSGHYQSRRLGIQSYLLHLLGQQGKNSGF
jgi:hypothetical protein